MKRTGMLLLLVAMILNVGTIAAADTFFQISEMEIEGVPYCGGSFKDYDENTGTYTYTGSLPFDPGTPLAYCGQNVGVTASVKNVGGSEGTAYVNLYVNGVLAETQAVDVAPGASDIVSFDVSFSRDGLATISVGNLEPQELEVSENPWDIKAVELKFDEGEGEVAFDSSGFGYDGIILNNPEWVSGKVGKALRFSSPAEDEDFSRVELPIGPNEIGLEGTMFLWFMPDWDDTTEGVMHTLVEATREETARAFHIGWGEEGPDLEFAFEDSTDYDWEAEGRNYRGSINSGEWYHIAAVWDGTTKEIACRLYVNGEEWRDVTREGEYMGKYEFFTVGAQRYDYWSKGSTDGTIDEFSVIPIALTAEQINQAYQEAIK